MKRGMTALAFQSLGISDDAKERLNRLVIGVATIAADNFRKRGSRLSSPAIWIWVKEKWGCLGEVLWWVEGC